MRTHSYWKTKKAEGAVKLRDLSDQLSLMLKRYTRFPQTRREFQGGGKHYRGYLVFHAVGLQKLREARHAVRKAQRQQAFYDKMIAETRDSRFERDPLV